MFTEKSLLLVPFWQVSSRGYLTYRSIWSCYVSHILADLAIAIVGWQLLFG